MSRDGDRYLLARACRVLLRSAGLEGDAHWTEHGPTRRASWLKGYLRRAPRRGARPKDEQAAPTTSWKGPIFPEETLSHREKLMLLVAFDLWNGSGDVSFGEVLKLPSALLGAVAALITARCADTPEALAEWIDRWS